MKTRSIFMGALAIGLLAGCQNSVETPISSDTADNSVSETFVSDSVKQANRDVEKYLDFNDRRDFEWADKGFIATFEDTKIMNELGGVAYDFGAHDFLKDAAPDTANPSLWRQSQLAAKHGLYQVTDRIYQVRNYDLANVTFIKGDTGWIVIDPVISKEAAARAMELVTRELGEFPISAVMFTHSHADHYGGVRGLISEDDIANGVRVIAPEGFVEEVVSEAAIAGNAMARRASYMFGGLLPKAPDGQIGVGLGQAISSGNSGLIGPTDEISKTGQILTVDGIEMEFIMALEAEAPTEFMFYLPQFKAFCQAEEINHTLHNLYTPRGAKVRNGRRWAGYIDEAIYTYGDKTDITFGSHHWPIWGQDDVVDFWVGQRDLYAYIHDQTLRLANNGATMHEIPDLLNIPDGIGKSFANRGYYGTVSHNSKAQYQLYYGYFDGNPANLDPLSPVNAGKKYVEYMGGAASVIEKARADFDAGEFRFAATALNHVVFAQPGNEEAANLLADCYTQMAYVAESGSWRNFYLTGASELRNGIRDLPALRTSGPDFVKAVPLDLYFDILASRLNGPKAADKDWTFNFEFTDTGETALVLLSNGTMHHRMGQSDPEPTATLKITRAGLDQLTLKEKTFADLAKDGAAKIEGNPLAFRSFFGLIEEPEFWFEIVRP